jgi:hypothetical protein
MNPLGCPMHIIRVILYRLEGRAKQAIPHTLNNSPGLSDFSELALFAGHKKSRYHAALNKRLCWMM